MQEFFFRKLTKQKPRIVIRNINRLVGFLKLGICPSSMYHLLQSGWL